MFEDRSHIWVLIPKGYGRWTRPLSESWVVGEEGAETVSLPRDWTIVHNALLQIWKFHSRNICHNSAYDHWWKMSMTSHRKEKWAISILIKSQTILYFYNVPIIRYCEKNQLDCWYLLTRKSTIMSASAEFIGLKRTTSRQVFFRSYTMLKLCMASYYEG